MSPATRREAARRAAPKRAKASPIKAISFDLDGTLVEDAKFAKLFWFEEIPRLYAAKYRIPLEEAKLIVTAEYRKVGPMDLDWYRPHFWFERFRLEEDWRKVIHDLRHHFKVFPDVKPALEELQKYRLVVITHSTKDFIRLKLEAESVKGYFAGVYSAVDDFSSVKSTELFRRLLERLGCEAGEVLHIGDDEDFDYAAPRSLGMKALLLDRSGKRKGKHVIRSLADVKKRL